jgi:hypothetical protein
VENEIADTEWGIENADEKECNRKRHLKSVWVLVFGVQGVRVLGFGVGGFKAQGLKVRG